MRRKWKRDGRDIEESENNNETNIRGWKLVDIYLKGFPARMQTHFCHNSRQ
jgi:hypothetical protein